MKLTALGAARVALAVGMAASVGGCVVPTMLKGGGQLPVDASSPVAKDLAYAKKHPGPYPHFTDIPDVPTDVRSSDAWRAAVLGIERDKAHLDTEVAALPPVQADTEGFAAQKRSKAAVAPELVPPPDAAQQTESYAETLRARATPPPPPK